MYHFIESRYGFTVWEDSAGNRVYFEDRPFGSSGAATPGLDLDFGIEAVSAGELSEDEFRDEFNLEVSECWNCSAWGVDHHDVDGNAFCQCCVDEMHRCDRCGEVVGLGNERYVAHGDVACDYCADEYSDWCDLCGETFWTDDGGHDHGDESTTCCEAPNQAFSIPDARGGTLENDTRRDVEVPDGVVEGYGLGWVRTSVGAKWSDWLTATQAAREEAGADTPNIHITWASVLDAVGLEWKDATGRTFPKRLRAAFYKATKHCPGGGFNIPAGTLESIGNYAYDSARGGSYSIEITRDLNRPAEDFVHEGSCWWSDYAYSRCTLKQNHGFGLRAFGSHGYPEGRAWVYPCTADANGNLTTTDKTPDVYLVFNAYGSMSERRAAQVVASLTGMVVHQTIETTHVVHDMYVNAGFIVVAPEGDTRTFTDDSLDIYTC